MKKRFHIVVGLVLLVAGFVSGYALGKMNAFQHFPLGIHLRDIEYDCQYVGDLKNGNVTAVLDILQTNLSEQIIELNWIWHNAPNKYERDRAFKLLLAIAENRSEYKLLPRETKGGLLPHQILDEELKFAGKNMNI